MNWLSSSSIAVTQESSLSASSAFLGSMVDRRTIITFSLFTKALAWLQMLFLQWLDLEDVRKQISNLLAYQLLFSFLSFAFLKLVFLSFFRKLFFTFLWDFWASVVFWACLLIFVLSSSSRSIILLFSSVYTYFLYKLSSQIVDYVCF